VTRLMTIVDVAKAAGVSVSAVSYAVNGRPGVSDATRARIIEVVAQLGWRPNNAARALVGFGTGAIGLVMARSADLLESDDFFSRFLVGVERVLATHGFSLVLQVVAAGTAREQEAYERLAHGLVDGIILTDIRIRDPRLGWVRQAGIPAVVAGNAGRNSFFPSVETDHVRGMKLATQHLLDLGHQDIAFIGGPQMIEHVRARKKAWMQTLRAAGVALGPVLHQPSSAEGGASALIELMGMRRKPTAVVITSDLMAFGVLGQAHALGVGVPRELSIVGFDDVPLARHATPALTTVAVDYVRFGAAAAAKMVSEVLRIEPSNEPIPPVTLSIRSSTAPPR